MERGARSGRLSLNYCGPFEEEFHAGQCRAFFANNGINLLVISMVFAISNSGLVDALIADKANNPGCGSPPKVVNTSPTDYSSYLPCSDVRCAASTKTWAHLFRLYVVRADKGFHQPVLSPALILSFPGDVDSVLSGRGGYSGRK